MALTLIGAGAPAFPPEEGDQVSGLIRDLSGADALAEFRASERLAGLGNAAVPALGELAANGKNYAPRMLAVEVLGNIGTPEALGVLIVQLKAEKHLAVRGQICIQLGFARDRRAVPVLCEWLNTIGPAALNDFQGPKEVQPSTCYLRHVEALGMIGDESAIPAIEEFLNKLPKGAGYGGFLTNFVTGGARDAIEQIRETAGFREAVRRVPGLDARLAPLFDHLRREPLARLRLHADEIVRRTSTGRTVLQSLSRHPDPKISAAARDLLAAFSMPDR